MGFDQSTPSPVVGQKGTENMEMEKMRSIPPVDIPLSDLESSNNPFEVAISSASISTPLAAPSASSPPGSPGSGSSSPIRSSPSGLSPASHTFSSWRIRGGKKLQDYDPLLNGEDFDDSASETVHVDNAVTVCRATRRRRRRWAVCGMVSGITLLGVLLVLNILLFISSRAWEDTEDPDDIFGNWGRPGTGTEGLAWYPTDFLRDVQPIACHSHNDYWRRVPLFSALRAGCIGVEADVWFFADRGDDLFVGHETAALQPNRTFQALYVDPLVDILKLQNPSNSFYNETRRGVFDVNPSQTLTLLVDIKTDGATTWRKAIEQLEPLRSRGWLSTFKDGKITYGPITVVGTGNTPFDVLMENATYRDYFFDAPLDKFEEDMRYNSTNSYYASTAFSSTIGSVWFGGLRPGQLRKLRQQVQDAHARGLKARYWDLPAWPIHVRNSIWDTLMREGVDLLNVDDLRGASKKDWNKI